MTEPREEEVQEGLLGVFGKIAEVFSILYHAFIDAGGTDSMFLTLRKKRETWDRAVWVLLGEAEVVVSSSKEAVSYSPFPEIRRKHIAKITDHDFLIHTILNDTDLSVQLAAIKQLEQTIDDHRIVSLICETTQSELALALLERLVDESWILRIAQTAKLADVRVQAITRLSDANKVTIAIDSGSYQTSVYDAVQIIAVRSDMSVENLYAIARYARCGHVAVTAMQHHPFAIGYLRDLCEHVEKDDERADELIKRMKSHKQVDDSFLLYVAKNAMLERMALAAITLVSDEDTLRALIKEAKHESVRNAVQQRLMDMM
ncbi:MAG: hypothetical protein ABIH21_02850 [Patescibacteria group bacterium]